MPSIEIVTPPATEPVSLAEAKLHLRVDHTDEDALITALIAAARQHVENVTGLQLISAGLVQREDRFPRGGGWIVLRRAPVTAVTGVSYVDAAGATQTLSTDVYVVDSLGAPARVALKYGQAWPPTRGQVNDVQVALTAGYGSAAAVPGPLKSALLLLVGHLFVNREMEITGTISTPLKFAVDALLAPYALAKFPRWE